MITLFTDGSSRGNPGRGGWGAIILYADHVIEIGGREEQTTNNRMEMMALLSGLQAIVKNKKEHAGNQKEKIIKILICTDSAYLLNGATRWIHGWKARQWLTSQNEPVLNRDIWETIDETIKQCVQYNFLLEWKLIKGHSGNVLNERCDVIATRCADNLDVDFYSGSLNEYPYIDLDGNKSLSVSESASLSIQPETSSKKNQKAKAYSYISSVNGVIMTHATWKECEDRIKGVSGARFKKALNKNEEEQIIKSFS